jgi:hypothetical protein
MELPDKLTPAKREEMGIKINRDTGMGSTGEWDGMRVRVRLTDWTKRDFGEGVVVGAYVNCYGSMSYMVVLDDQAAGWAEGDPLRFVAKECRVVA